MMNNENNEMEIDLRELFMVLRRRILIIILTAVIFAGGAGVYSFFMAEPVYQSTSRLYIQSQSTSITSLADVQIGSYLAQDYVEFIKSRTLAEEVIGKLNLKNEEGEKLAYTSLVRNLTVTNPEDTRILNISYEGTDPVLATKIANEYAKVARKNISSIMNVDEPSLWELAVIPKNPVKPEKTKNVILAFIIGAVLASVLSIVAHLMNDAIRTPDDIEAHLGLTTLASIPYEGDKKKKDKKQRRKSKNKKSNRRRKK